MWRGCWSHQMSLMSHTNVLFPFLCQKWAIFMFVVIYIWHFVLAACNVCFFSFFWWGDIWKLKCSCLFACVDRHIKVMDDCSVLLIVSVYDLSACWVIRNSGEREMLCISVLVVFGENCHCGLLSVFCLFVILLTISLLSTFCSSCLLRCRQYKDKEEENQGGFFSTLTSMVRW